MTRTLLHSFLSMLISAAFLAGCGSTQTPPITTTEESATPVVETPTPDITMTPDLCAPGNIEAEINKVHSHMREFDDSAILASYTSRDRLSDSIADLQRIRREAEDELIPPCLTILKAYQIQHMNSVINTLIAFMGGGDQLTLDQGITIARQQHDQYTLELARLLGITVVPATVIVTPSQTPTP